MTYWFRGFHQKCCVEGCKRVAKGVLMIGDHATPLALYNEHGEREVRAANMKRETETVRVPLPPERT